VWKLCSFVLWVGVCLFGAPGDEFYFNGQKVFDLVAGFVYYPDANDVNRVMVQLSDGGIFFRNGVAFRKPGTGNHFLNPEEAILQVDDVNMIYPGRGSLFNGDAFSHANSRLWFSLTPGLISFSHDNGMTARDTVGKLRDSTGTIVPGPVVMFNNLKDPIRDERLGYIVAVVNSESFQVEINYTGLFLEDEGIQVLPLRYNGNQAPQTLADVQIIIELGHDRRGLLVSVKNSQVTVKAIDLLDREWKILHPAGLLEIKFDRGVKAVSAFGELRSVMNNIIKTGQPQRRDRFRVPIVHDADQMGTIVAHTIFAPFDIDCAQRLLIQTAGVIGARFLE